MQNICHQFLANSFNSTKTKKDDISRFQNLHLKIVPTKDLNLEKEKNIDDKFNEENVSNLKKKQVTTICHVYQTKYNNINVTGLGDFIRGCFFTLQFCGKHNFKCEILINHPISIFLKNVKLHSLYPKLYNTLNFTQCNLTDTIFSKNNNIENFILAGKTNDFVKYLCNLKIMNHTIFSYNILHPYDKITDEECDIVKTLLEPSDEMEQYINDEMTKYGIIKKQFIVIHVRSGDTYLKKETKIFNSHYFKTLTREIFNIIKYNNGNDLLLIADNNEIKYMLYKKFPRIKILYKDITHLGEGITLEKENVKNTMIDFYLFSNASRIFSFSVYRHGSGFSYWCSKIYNIPYTCKFIQN